MFRATGIAILWFMVGNSAFGQSKLTENTLKLDNPESAPKATLKDVAWLQGFWKGEGMGGQCDEMWSPAAAGTMVGTFRLMREDKLVFSEFIKLMEENGTLIMKLKHFHPDMKGWEEKDKSVTFPLVKVEPNAVCFNGLTYRKNADGFMTVFLAMRLQSGMKEQKFEFKPIVANVK